MKQDHQPVVLHVEVFFHWRSLVLVYQLQACISTQFVSWYTDSISRKSSAMV